MSPDPILRLARQRIIKASADLEVQLLDKTGSGPAIEILRRLKDRAAESLAGLPFCDAEDAHLIRVLQNEVKRYDEWVAWLRDIIQEGRAYDRDQTEQEREELLDLLAANEDGEREAIALGLIDEVPKDA
jgi:cytochrome P450